MDVAANYAQFKLRDMNRIALKRLKANAKPISYVAGAVAFGLVVFGLLQHFYLAPNMRANKLLHPNQEFIPSDPSLGNRARMYLFYATWCPHSKKAMPEWNRFKSRVKGNNVQYNTVEFEEVDGDDEGNQQTLKQFGIDSFPLVRMSYKGKVYVFEGKITENSLNGFLEEFVTFPKKVKKASFSLKNDE
jgi:thiol-disulfide isomerase/thioredoxin